MKRAKIEAKLVKIFKDFIPKELRAAFKKNANHMYFTCGYEENTQLIAGTNELVLSPQHSQEVFNSIEKTFKVSGIELAQTISRLFNISGLAELIKFKQDAPYTFNFGQDNNAVFIDRGRLMTITVNETASHPFNTNEQFWQAFDTWYKENRKRLFTKPKKEKPVKQAKPEKVKEPKPKKVKKNKTEAAAPVLQ